MTSKDESLQTNQGNARKAIQNMLSHMLSHECKQYKRDKNIHHNIISLKTQKKVLYIVYPECKLKLALVESGNDQKSKCRNEICIVVSLPYRTWSIKVKEATHSSTWLNRNNTIIRVYEPSTTIIAANMIGQAKKSGPLKPESTVDATTPETDSSNEMLPLSQLSLTVGSTPQSIWPYSIPYLAKADKTPYTRVRQTKHKLNINLNKAEGVVQQNQMAQKTRNKTYITNSKRKSLPKLSLKKYKASNKIKCFLKKVCETFKHESTKKVLSINDWIIGLKGYVNYKLKAIKRGNYENYIPQYKKSYYNHVTKIAKMPTAGEANLNKRMRSQDDLGNTNNKKVCDPRADAKIPKAANPGKRNSQQPKAATLPTEAQVKQAEIMKKARGYAIAAQVAEADLALGNIDNYNNNNAVEVEDIGPENDIFDEVVNNPNFPNENLIDPSATTETEDFLLPEDPVERAIRNNDPYISVQYLPEPKTNPMPPPTPRTPTPMPSTSAGPSTSQHIDLGFVLALSSDPYKALDLARNISEVEQAKKAIAELESVSQPPIYVKCLAKVVTISHILARNSNKKPNKCKFLDQSKNLKTHFLHSFQARHAVSPASDSWVQQIEQEELAAARRAALLRKLKLPADPKPKESGFAPSSSRKNNGRGAKNTRGTTRGRGSARGSRGGARGGARGSTRTTPKTQKKTTATLEDGDASDESEIDATAPIMSQIRHAIATVSYTHLTLPTTPYV